MKLLMSFGVHYKSGQFLIVISIHLRAFSEGQGTELESFCGVANFQVFFWVWPIFLILFFFGVCVGGGGGKQ